MQEKPPFLPCLRDPLGALGGEPLTQHPHPRLLLFQLFHSRNKSVKTWLSEPHSAGSRTGREVSGMVACNFSTWDAETGGLPGVYGQSGLQRPCHKNTKQPLPAPSLQQVQVFLHPGSSTHLI